MGYTDASYEAGQPMPQETGSPMGTQMVGGSEPPPPSQQMVTQAPPPATEQTAEDSESPQKTEGDAGADAPTS
eukprot:NODE_3837_length_376_cov_288.103976_g3266_i0.p2 GENE.NODE_3837_length_376_cov_288.103976_g3266_i0~~NODE_3837_length_376_cov_288.103976_g3266_i0.p2  ORF type:complete len:73 (-),score=10.64 NODE_3837_length_376_cov_288.103976_g3266_i0:127-345(-)